MAIMCKDFKYVREIYYAQSHLYNVSELELVAVYYAYIRNLCVVS